MSIDQAQVVGIAESIAVVEVGIPGPAGDITASAQIALNKVDAQTAAAQNAANAAQDYADVAKEYSSQASSSASSAFAASAEAWNISKTYNYPVVVAYTDGNTYRCIGANITGEKPGESPNWVRITLDIENFFDIDVSGGLMPAQSPSYSGRWELDGNGNIMPKGDA